MLETNLKLVEDHGAVLTGRAAAASLVARILACLSEGERVVVDFTGVHAVSPSFADELFGKLGTRVESSQLRFANLSPHLTAVAKMANSHRREIEDQLFPPIDRQRFVAIADLEVRTDAALRRFQQEDGAYACTPRQIVEIVMGAFRAVREDTRPENDERPDQG